MLKRANPGGSARLGPVSQPLLLGSTGRRHGGVRPRRRRGKFRGVGPTLHRRGIRLDDSRENGRPAWREGAVFPRGAGRGLLRRHRRRGDVGTVVVGVCRVDVDRDRLRRRLGERLVNRYLGADVGLAGCVGLNVVVSRIAGCHGRAVVCFGAGVGRPHRVVINVRRRRAGVDVGRDRDGRHGVVLVCRYRRLAHGHQGQEHAYHHYHSEQDLLHGRLLLTWSPHRVGPLVR